MKLHWSVFSSSTSFSKSLASMLPYFTFLILNLLILDTQNRDQISSVIWVRHVIILIKYQVFLPQNMLQLFQTFKMIIKVCIVDQNGIQANNNIDQIQNVPNFLRIRTQMIKFTLRITYQRLSKFFKECKCIVNHNIINVQDNSLLKGRSQDMPIFISFGT